MEQKEKTSLQIKRFLRTSDTIFVILLIAGFVLEYFYPWDLDDYVTTFFQFTVGLFVFLIGALLIIEAKLEFKRYNQSTSGFERKTKLVTTGVFRYSRNPLYLGLIIAFLGLGITTGMMWWIVFNAAAVLLFNIILIRREEKYLTEIFGDEYKEYCRRVGRWVGFKIHPEK